MVDPASIAAPRRRRRAKTDKLDGEALARGRTWLDGGGAFARGGGRAPPLPQAPGADPERVSHVNRIKGLLFAQGIGDYAPLSRNRRKRLDELRTGDGRALPPHLKAQIGRELDRLEMVLEQIKAVEKERNRLLFAPEPEAASGAASAPGAAMLAAFRGIGPDSAATLWSEGLSRHFSNRRQIGAYAGFAPTPWRSGSVAHEQGVSKAGNPRLRTTMVQVAWLWLQHQPQSALARWYFERVGGCATKARKKATIVALARKLLVALWKYGSAGEVVEGAVMTAAA